MKIESISARIEKIELSRPYAIAFRDIGDVSIGVVEVCAEGGLVGRGAASPEPYVTGESIERVSEVFGDLDGLTGRDARQVRALCREIEARAGDAPAARAAVDMALCDLFAQRVGLPLVELLGRAHDGLPTSVTIGISSVDDTLAEAREYTARGFRVLKIKLGRELAEDLERVRRLRAELPRGIALRVDANRGYDASELARFVRETEELDVEFIEQPSPPSRTDELRGLGEPIRARLAADESLLAPADALALLSRPRPFGIWNIKLMKCGGVLPALRIAELAELSGTALMWGCNDESRISIAAALHAALASPATRYLDLDGHLDLAWDVATSGGFVLEDGVLRPSGGPGLGLTGAQ